MKLVIKILLPVLIFIAAVYGAKVIKDRKPEPNRRPQPVKTQAVEAITVKPSSYQVNITSQGTIRPSREGAVVPEITGAITQISPNFVAGGYFTESELLVEIDRRDFEIALTQAKATRAQANAVLQEEQARSKQALADWKSLGRSGKPSALTVRGPQLAAARANLASANAQIEKAQLDLARTQLFAPYAGRVLEKRVDVGEFVNRGAVLGRIHSIDAVEVRLPLSNRQLTHLTLPDGSGNDLVADNVTLSAQIGGREVSWPGTLIRSEGIDTTSQQLHCIVQVKDPLGSGAEPLRIGQYVKAEIQGNKLENVFVVPRSTVREDREVVLVDKDKKLQIRPVTIAWADDANAAISEGLATNDVLALTTLGSVANGTPVSATIDGVAPEPPQRGNRQAGGSRPGNGGDGKGGEGKRGKNQSGKSPDGKPARGQSGSKAGEQTPPAGARDGGRERLKALKEIVDGGGEIPDEDKERIRARIASGAPVPPWLKQAVE